MAKPPEYPDFYEQKAWQNGLLVCGIDEVGRGCLAGPLITAAAILPLNCKYPLADSKKLTAKQREMAYGWLTENAHFTIARGDHDAIARHNIYQATKQAMRSACLMMAHLHPALFSATQYIAVDAMPLTLPATITWPEVVSFIKGEDYSRSIAAASIIAKVTRDRLMKEIAPLFPSYTFAKDKAYASPAHCKTITSSSATFIHRSQFIATVRMKKKGPLT